MVELKEYLRNFGVDTNTIILDWFNTCFSEFICPEQLFKIYDILLITNNYQIMILIALAILESRKSKLMTKVSKEEIITVFKNMKYEDIDVFNTTKSYFDNNLVNNI